MGSQTASHASTTRFLLLALILAICLNVWQAVTNGGADDVPRRSCPPVKQCEVCKVCPEQKVVAAAETCMAKAEDTDANADNALPAEGDAAAVGGGAVADGAAGEEGWVLNLERVASKTANTEYKPENDKALVANPKRYARSPVPKGSWKVRVADNKWVTMDEVAFAYDVWFEENQVFQYMSWMGVYVQQDPMDAFAIQDMLWRVKPDLIVEVGSNTGGGAIFYATIMKAYNPKGKIVTLDVKEISNWNQKNNNRCVGCVLATEHSWWGDGMIHFIKGRVTEKETSDKVQTFVDQAKVVLVIEDASHRYPDTLQNMEAIYKWVTPNSYMLVQDTKMDRFVAGLGRKYGKLRFGPMRSVDEFIAKHSDFVVDRRFEYLLYSQHHRGFLRRKAQ